MQPGGKAKSQIAAGVLAGALVVAPLQTASAGNLFESLFGGLSRALRHAPEVPPEVRSFVEPLQRGVEHAVNPQSAQVAQGPAKAFCVRTCDGHYFPVQAHAGMSAVEACHSFCPASETRLYSGSDIDYAVTRDGSRYASLPNAYAYRKHLVAGCTCNGKSQFGLAAVNIAEDPTLRPGDVVATKNGMVAFTGRSDKVANFTPADSYQHFSKGYRDKLADMEVRTGTR